MTPTTAPQHWLDIAAKRTDDPVAHYAALGLAHMKAFHAAVDTYGDVCWGASEPTEADKERFRAAVRAHLHEYAAAFTVCALLKGWTIEAINQELEDGQVAAECLWSWVGEGVDPESIAAADGPVDAEVTP